MRHEGSARETIGMVVCAILSLAAFLTLVLLLERGLLPAFLAVIISLACPVVWLVLLWGSGGTGLEQQGRQQRFGSTAEPLPRAVLTDAAI